MQPIIIRFSHTMNDEFYEESITDLFTNFDTHYKRLLKNFDHDRISITCGNFFHIHQIDKEFLKNRQIDVFKIIFIRTLTQAISKYVGSYVIEIISPKEIKTFHFELLKAIIAINEIWQYVQEKYKSSQVIDYDVKITDVQQMNYVGGIFKINRFNFSNIIIIVEIAKQLCVNNEDNEYKKAIEFIMQNNLLNY